MCKSVKMIKIFALFLILNFGILVGANDCNEKYIKNRQAYYECIAGPDDFQSWVEQSYERGDFNKTDSDDIAKISSELCNRLPNYLSCYEIKLKDMGDSCSTKEYAIENKMNVLKRNITKYLCDNDGEVLKVFHANNGYNIGLALLKNIEYCFDIRMDRPSDNEISDDDIVNITFQFMCSALKSGYICIRANILTFNQELKNISKNIYTIIYDELACQSSL